MPLRALGVEMGATYELVGPDGTRAVFNNSADADFVGYLTEPPAGLERAGVRENADLLTEADGGVHGPFYRDRMPFTLSGVIDPRSDGPASAAQNRLLRAASALRGDARLRWTPSTVTEGVEVYFREQNPARITGRRPKQFLVAGVAEDPTVKSQTLRTAIVDTMAYSAYAAAYNEGSAPAWPKLYMRGPVTNPYFSKTTGYGQDNTGRLEFATTLAANEYLVIDTDPRRRRIRRGFHTAAGFFNLINNPSFEVDTAGWSASGGTATLSRDNWATSGAWSLKLSGSVTSNDGSAYSPEFAAGAGNVISARADINVVDAFNNAANPGRMSVQFDDGSGNWATRILGPIIAAGTGLRTLTVTAATAPTGTTRGRLRLQGDTTGADTFDWRIDSVIAQASSTVPTYVDGQTPGYGWEGTAHNSRTVGTTLPDANLSKAWGTLNFAASSWWPLTSKGRPENEIVFTGATSIGQGALGWVESRDSWG